jgi:hypothetical protein
MTMVYIIIAVAGLLLIQAAVWVLRIRKMHKNTQLLARKLRDECRAAGKKMLAGPQLALHRSIGSTISDMRDNGIICLTDRDVMFEQLTGQRTDISRADIAEVTIEDTPLDRAAKATGGQFMVIKTKDDNRIGFIMRDAGKWLEHFKS